jgi:hypothetical protein
MKKFDVISSQRPTSRNIEIEVGDCRKCPFRQGEHSTPSGFYCSYLAYIAEGEGMEPLRDFDMSLEEVPPPDWCGLKRASVTISIDPLYESRCPAGGDHEPIQKLSATVCGKCHIVLEDQTPLKLPVGHPYCDECKRAGSTHSALCDCNCHRGGELPL